MLRTYKPITHEIFKLQNLVEHLVCEVWCKADSKSCVSKMSPELKDIYATYSWLKKEVDAIYKEFRILDKPTKEKVKQAFFTNNEIEKLCNKEIAPVYLSDLPEIVELKIKPLMVNFYNDLLEKAKVPGTKKSYYEKLYEVNEFEDCPCCGLMLFENEDSERREALDHYLPKAHYPFSSINFKNLVPLCYKCNSDRKKAKDPIEKGRKAIYPYGEDTQVRIKTSVKEGAILGKLEDSDITIELSGQDNDKIDTWDWLFDIKDRYRGATKTMSKRLLREFKRRHRKEKENKSQWTYKDTLEKLIEDYEPDRFTDKRFLKIPFMEGLKDRESLLKVYE